MATLRNSNDIIKGSHLMVFMDVDGTMTPIAFATSHTFSKSLNTQEISCKDFGDVAAVIPQNYTWSMQTDNLYSVNGYKLLNDAFKNMTKVTVYFGESTYSQTTAQSSIVDVDPAPADWTLAGFGEQGDAYITSLDVTASAGENATFSATFQGTGTLEEIDSPTPPPPTVYYTVSLSADPETQGHITVTPYTATAGTTITVAPDGASYYNDSVNITTTPSTVVTWDNVNTIWTFTMPAANTTVTSTAIPKYTVQKGGDMTEFFEIEPSTYVGENSYVYIVPDDPANICPPAYIAWTDPSETITWISDESKWQLSMPAHDICAYVGPSNP